MPSPGSPSDFIAWKVLAVVMFIAGLVGVGLVLGAGAVLRRGKDSRAGYLHEQKMTGLWDWAQGLGPRKRRGK
jgi:hypothetical protein